MLQFFNKKNVWLYLLVITSVVMFIGEILNERFYMHDFEVYYKTANRFLQGEQLYRIAADGHFVYKYSPTCAIYFIPLSFLPYWVASIIFWFLITSTLALILHTFYRLTASDFAVGAAGARQKNVVLFLTFLCAVTHYHRELHLGQVNLLLLALFVFTLLNLVLERYKTAGFILAASLFIKPFGLIFLPYFILKNKLKALLLTLVFVVVLGLLPLLFYPSLTAFKQLYLSWFQELAIEMKAKQSLLQPGNHTIFSVMARYTPLQYVLGSAGVVRIYQLVMLGLVGLGILFFMRLGRNLKKAQSMVAEGAILICLVPLFAVTSMNAFLFALPCIIFLIYHAGKLPGWARIALIAGCILIGGNNYDLMGRRVYDILEAHSVYTFGALILLGLMFYFRYKLGKEDARVNQTIHLTGETVLK